VLVAEKKSDHGQGDAIDFMARTATLRFADGSTG
jgi:hypothetical protein